MASIVRSTMKDIPIQELVKSFMPFDEAKNETHILNAERTEEDMNNDIVYFVLRNDYTQHSFYSY